MGNRRDGPLSYAPAFVVLLGLAFSLYASYSGFSPLTSAVISVLIASSWIFIGTFVPTDGWFTTFVLILLMTFGISLWLSNRISFEPQIPSTIETEGKVVRNSQWGRRRVLLISTGYGKMAAYTHPSSAPQEGSKVILRGATFDFKRSDRKGSFDEYLYWRSKGAAKKIIPLELHVTAPPQGIYRWRNFLERKISEDLPELMSGYMFALTLGIRDKKLAEKHRDAGTVHLLAVSGFHVGILAAMAGLFLKRGRLRIVLISLLVWSYVSLAGFPSGGVRAAIMLQVYLLGLFLGKPSSPFNSVSAAGIIMLLFNPWTFHDIGWRLSMLAALSLSASAGIFKDNIARVLAGSTVIWFVTSPLIAFAFGKVPIVGLVINIVAIPLFALIFPFVFLCSLPAFLGLPFSWEIAYVCEYFLESWDIFSGKLVEIMPWNVGLTVPLLLFSMVLFFAAASYASGMSLKRIPAAALMFPLLVLLFA